MVGDDGCAEKISPEVQTRDGFYEKTRLVSIGVLLRAASLAFVSDSIHDRVELATPVFDYLQLRDDVALRRAGFTPYDLPGYHFQPIFLLVASFSISDLYMTTFFIALDVLIALLLAKAVEHVETNSERQLDAQLLVLKIYLFNPVTISSCSIYSLSTLQNLCAALLVYLLISKKQVAFVLVLSVWSTWTVYPAMCFSSLFLMGNSIRKMTLLFVLALTTIFLATATNFLLNGKNWSFLDPSYLHILRYDDISPNTGIYWYFFVQIFDHFRNFYVITFQSIYWLLTVPITLSMRSDAKLHLWLCLLFGNIFFPYPTLNGASVIFAMFPLFAAYNKYWRYKLLVGATVVATCVLMPVMWHMWMVSSSGNANFFFAVTLIYNVALIYFVMDICFVYFRKQIDDNYPDIVTKKTKFSFSFY